MRELTRDDVRIDRLQIITAPAWAYERGTPIYELWEDLIEELERMRDDAMAERMVEADEHQKAADDPANSVGQRALRASLAKLMRRPPWEGRGMYRNDLTGSQPPDAAPKTCIACGSRSFSATRTSLCTDSCVKSRRGSARGWRESKGGK